MEKLFALVESIPAGRVKLIDNITFDEMKAIVHKYSASHTCKLFGVEVCTLHGIVLLAKELPVCPITSSLGYFEEEKVADYHDRSRTWYAFMGKSTARYTLAVHATPPSDKPPRNIISLEDPNNNIERKIDDVFFFITNNKKTLDELDEKAIVCFYELEMFEKDLINEHWERISKLLDSVSVAELIIEFEKHSSIPGYKMSEPCTALLEEFNNLLANYEDIYPYSLEQQIRRFAVFEKAEEILQRKPEA